MDYWFCSRNHLIARYSLKGDRVEYRDIYSWDWKQEKKWYRKTWQRFCGRKIIHWNKKNAAVKEFQENFIKEAKIKSERESSRIIEGGKLEAKKILFEAINTNLDSNFDSIKQELGKFTKSADYKKIIQKMIETSKKKLGKEIVIHCRKEDESLFKEKGITVGSSIQTIGGIIAENKKGTKELELTFEELLRSHEDEIKNKILEKIL